MRLITTRLLKQVYILFGPFMINNSLKKGVFFIGVLLFWANVSAQYIDRSEKSILLKNLSESQPDTNRIQLLISLGKFHTYNEGKTARDLDSGYIYLNWARKLSDTLNIQYFQHQTESMLVTFMLNNGDVMRAEKRYSALINECDRTGDKQVKADAMFRHAIFWSSADKNFEVAKKEFAETANIYHQLREPKEEARQYYELAFINFKQGKFDLAEKELLEVVQKDKAINSPRLLDTYSLLSKLYRVRGDFNNGLKYAILASESAQKSTDKHREAYYYGDLARMYKEVGENNQAIIWYQKAVNKWRTQGLAYYEMYLEQGYLVTELLRERKDYEALREVKQLEAEIPPVTMIQKACVSQNLAICYNALKQYDLAEKYFLNAANLYQHSEFDFEGPQELYPLIGRFYLEQRKYQKADIYLQQALGFKPQHLSPAAIRDVHYMLFKVDSAGKNYLAAIDHQRMGKALDDSLFNSTKIREIEKLQIQFKTTETDERYRSEAKLQSIKLVQAHQMQKVTIGFASFLLMISVLIFNQYRIKQSSNKLLQAHQVKISGQNVTLQSLVEEKEWLVKEIHHRVKNNLQTIVSLLESQTVFLNNSDALAAVKDSQHRIHAMSLIHQKLYLTDNVTTVNMSNYMDELVKYLSESFSNSWQIKFDLNVSPLDIDVAIAIPLGLILNEAITNSIKYAFDKNQGTITIQFYEEDLTYKLIIADDGVGLPANFNDSVKINSLGMTLMKGLCKEIGASFEIKNNKGVKISIAFKPLSFKKNGNRNKT